MTSSDLQAALGTSPEVVSPALALTIYFRAPVAEYADGAIYCMESFLAQCEGDITFYADEDIGRFRKAKPTLLRKPIDRLRDSKRKMPFYSWVMTSGAKADSASDISFLAYTRENDPHKLSFIRASFPISAFLGEDGATNFLELTCDWASRLPFLHGYGGLALNQSMQPGTRQLNSAEVFALARRFPGFEVDDCGGTVLVAQEAIKGVNWLTLVGSRFVERLAGSEVLRGQLSSEITFYPLGSRGLLIRAGKEPVIGDMDAGDRCPLYGEVSRALAPIRLSAHPALGPIEFGSFGPQGTAEWLARFD